MKLKHNKKRNTAFLYEVLVRHLTKSILENDSKKKKLISRIFKSHFCKGTALREELDIFKAVISESRLDYHLAEKLIFEAKRTHARLDRQQLFKEQSALIKKINQALSKEAYSVFVPNYKNLATIQQIFNDQLPLKAKMILEEKFVRNLSYKRSTLDEGLVPISNIVYKTFVSKFNKEYDHSLLKEQKALLNKYITSFNDNGLDLKLFLNEEVARLKAIIEEAVSKEEYTEEGEVANKIKEVINVLEGFRERKVDQAMVEQVLKIQSLVKEI